MARKKGSITIGSRIKVKFEGMHPENFEIVREEISSAKDADGGDRQYVSIASPFARKVMGAKEGDEVEVETPAGKHKVEILEVEPHS